MTATADLPRGPDDVDTASAVRQLAVALAVGVVVAVVVGVLAPISLAPLAGFDAAALLYTVRVWVRVWSLDAEQTAKLAVHEDPTRAVADVVLLVASVAALVAIGVVVVQGASSHGSGQTLRVALGVGSVVVAWATVHTVFMLKYARLYYSGPDGGVDFKSDDPPPYSDFAYLAFTLGMTFQVSDTDLQNPSFRRLALAHALLSYLFGTVIVATVINLVAQLVSGGG